MPIYEYRCEDGHTFEVMQKMADEPVSVCEVCGKPVQRVFHPVAVHYKGSGFYSTDYGSKRGSGSSEGGKSESGSGESSGESSSGSEKKSDSASSSSGSDSSKKPDSKKD